MLKATEKICNQYRPSFSVNRGNLGAVQLKLSRFCCI